MSRSSKLPPPEKLHIDGRQELVLGAGSHCQPLAVIVDKELPDHISNVWESLFQLLNPCNLFCLLMLGQHRLPCGVHPSTLTLYSVVEGYSVCLGCLPD